jgi:CheY-like chemotaxis protein
MSKIEANKFELSYTEFDFSQLLRRVVDFIRFRVQKKGQSLSVQLDPNTPLQLVCDEQRLTQVLINLITNAVKFTPESGNISLIAQSTHVSEDNVTLLIELRDTGIGISSEQQQNLFTAFEQADGSISRQFGGTGLGLAISKRIIELMGGRIWVESELGEGSSFFIELELEKGKAAARTSSAEVDVTSLNVLAEDLPLTPEAPADDQSTEHVDVSAEADNPAGQEVIADGVFCDKTILVAEDVDINREILDALLESTGIKIDFAFDGLEAVRKFSSGANYDLILMDIQMPKADGLEATRRIRASGLPRAETIPIIAMTANVFKEDIERCIAAGMNGHLGKPVDMEKVMATLTQYLT